MASASSMPRLSDAILVRSIDLIALAPPVHLQIRRSKNSRLSTSLLAVPY